MVDPVPQRRRRPRTASSRARGAAKAVDEASRSSPRRRPAPSQAESWRSAATTVPRRTNSLGGPGHRDRLRPCPLLRRPAARRDRARRPRRSGSPSRETPRTCPRRRRCTARPGRFRRGRRHPVEVGAGSFDAIVSFEMLEHVQRHGLPSPRWPASCGPAASCTTTTTPSSARRAGTRLCTLAFPWGHARLDAADFERYVRELRPTELDQALRFYRESLNRMTLADLRAAVVGAGLELLALSRGSNGVSWQASIPRPPRGAAPLPDRGLDDLLATFVAVVARRPDPAPGPGRSVS